MSRRRRKKRQIAQPVQTVAGQAAAGQSGAMLTGQPLLDAAEKAIEAQMTPENRANYMKIVVAGQRAGLANGMNSIIAGLAKSKDPVADCAKGALAIAIILKHQAKGVMPLQAMIPAAGTLMLKALSFADRAGIVKVGPDELAHATKIFTNVLMAKLKITPQMLHNAHRNVNALANDPVAMEQMKRTAGVVRHPDASTPTPMPQGGADVAT